MGGNQSIEDRAVGLKLPQRANLVEPHQPAILGDIGRKDGGKLSFDYMAFCHGCSVPALIATNSFDTSTIAIIPPLFDLTESRSETRSEN